jgi:(1->4)-alpha-D-glucan 1-alpha-D-glucosylmutase
VEKILAPGETLPVDWGVNGTTGYDFMNDVSALLHDGRGETLMTQLWTALSGRAADFETEERLARSELLHASFTSHLRGAADAFHRLALFAARQIGEDPLQRALAAVLEHFRAYRTYATGISPLPPPGPIFETAVSEARGQISSDNAEALDFIASVMRGDFAEFGQVAWRATRRFNQLAAPVAAKAVEDTAFFRYGRLLSRNDVGFAPGIFAFSDADFDASTAKRAADFPHALLATATHDHKRGEDVRARLAVLSEIAEEWRREVHAWFELNKPLRSGTIDTGDEYQLYQTLLGTWPTDLAAGDSRLSDYAARILGWREKSLREAKLKTSWTEPNADFEQTNMDFMRAILDPTVSEAFLNRLAVFVARIAPAGALNGLTQCILRCTLPGVPDLYRGAEFWDLSLVDPDNRRPVDYTARTGALAQRGSPASLLHHWQDGHLKQSLITHLLALRACEPDCFADGSYERLPTIGPRENHVIAFLRRHRGKAILVAAPRLCALPCISDGSPLPATEFWEDTHIDIPGPERTWQSALDPGVGYRSRASFACAELFAEFPAAVLH